MTAFKHKIYKIENFIDIVKNKQDRPFSYDPDFNYNIYGDDSSGGDFHSNMDIYVGDTVEFTDDGEEIYPDAVLSQGLSFLYSCENFQAVVDLALSQDSGVSHEKIIECLNYYNEYDDFLDIN